ncbi:septum site-determining protein Ssd [Rhodococcus sp. NPDC058521]|uniref:septum site-determining protein Ssd n=1 Tax=Rhodococcus sp. NPDC058521 TaxID=3346536 RepID=UPI00366488CA
MDNESNSAAPARPVVLSLVAEAAMVASVRRVAAAADRVLHEAHATEAWQSWDTACAVVLDARAVTAIQGQLRRRAGVILLCDGPPDLVDWKAAATVGAEHVLCLPKDEGSLVTIFGERDLRPDADGLLVAVVGASGGAGASTMASALAFESSRAAGSPTTLLVDADEFGSGIDVLLGIENNPGLRWPGLTVEGGRIAADALRDALPECGPALRVLSCGGVRRTSVGPVAGDTANGPTPAAMRAVIESAGRAGYTVVCDVPRSPSAVTDLVLTAADLVVLVVPATIRSCLAAQRVAAWVAAHNPNVGLVVRGPAPGNLTASDVVDALRLPLLAAVRADRTLDRAIELRGFTPKRRSPLLACARAILAVLENRPRRGDRVA